MYPSVRLKIDLSIMIFGCVGFSSIVIVHLVQPILLMTKMITNISYPQNSMSMMEILNFIQGYFPPSLRTPLDQASRTITQEQINLPTYPKYYERRKRSSVLPKAQDDKKGNNLRDGECCYSKREYHH